MGQTASSTQHPATSSSLASCPVDHSAFEKRTQESSSSPSSASSSCPVDHASLANRAPSTSRSASASCPVDHASSSRPSSAAAAAAPAQCPVQHAQPQRSTDGETLDPRNQLPVLTQDRAPSQDTDLPTERTESSIPRDAAGNWDYPSPQQFYNALVRKGLPTPEDEIETMVQIHNFLNERAWDEVQKWEARVNKCVVSSSLDRGASRASDGRVFCFFGRDERLQLVRFKGRPGELSPKARFFLFAGWLLPDRFKYVFENTFDPHISQY